MTIHVCCKCMFQIFQLFSNVCCRCFIWMLHMLQRPYTYVTNVYYKCFICFGHILQQMLLYCKCFMSRHGKGAQAKVVPSGAVVPACAQKAKRAR